jgi:signal transduction histidine kinase/ActR/RegA family two-component response regulator
VDSGNVGVAQLGGEYYLAAAAPIVLDGFTIGTVILGERIDQAYVRRLQVAFDGEVEVRAGTRVVGSTLPASTRAPLPAAMPASGSVRSISLDGEDYVAAVLTLGATAEGDDVSVWMLRPVGRTVRELTGGFARDFLLVGVAALLLAVLGAALAARAILAPLHGVVSLMREGARTGVVRRSETPAGAPREIRWLADSYGQLAKALDAEREAVRRRTEQLEATNADLTQQVLERVRVESALHEREEQLRQAQKLEALGTLAGGVAHDFNNLLTVISGFTQLAIVRADEPVREDLQQVKDAAHRAGELTAQLLAFGRKQVLRPRVLDLNETVRGIEKMLQRVVGAAHELRLELEPQLARVHADPGQLEQVLMNLVINARDAMPEGGTLLIRTANVRRNRNEAGVALTVRDSGIGMDAATRARVFEPFFTTKELGKGTGLGLATVYGIVQQSGGTISVESTPGAGSTFSVVLPAVTSAESAGVASDEWKSAPRGAETLLLVEDEAPLRALATRVLEAQGYRVLAAAEGAEALQVAERFPGVIDLLVTDLVMPRMTGREVARRLMLSRPETRVLYMSGHAPDAVGSASDFAGAAFLAKPFAPDQLARAVRETLDERAFSGAR